MDTITVRRGETLPLPVEIDDDTAATVTIIVKESADSASVILTKTASFTDSVADLTLDDSETLIATGDYVYQLTVTYADSTVEKFPDLYDCDDGECPFPEFIVCDALDSPEVS